MTRAPLARENGMNDRRRFFYAAGAAALLVVVAFWRRDLCSE